MALIAMRSSSQMRRPGAASTPSCLRPSWSPWCRPIFMMLTALKSEEEYTFNKLGLPQAPVLDHFRAVLFDSPFLAWMGNSLILAAGAVAAQHRRLLPRRLCHRADGVQGPARCCSRSAPR